MGETTKRCKSAVFTIVYPRCQSIGETTKKCKSAVFTIVYPRCL